MMDLQRTWSAVLQLFTVGQCCLCDRATVEPLCQDCRTQVQSTAYGSVGSFRSSSLSVFAWGKYGGALRRAIAALKYDNQPQLAETFGQWLGQAWLASADATGQRRRSLVVVPVPANAAKKQRRGYDQAELLAQAFCRCTRLRLVKRCVVRTADTVPMHGLSMVERQRNVADVFQLHPQWHRHVRANDRILLLDDIYTTGSTIGAIAMLLRQHHIAVHGAITLARAGQHQQEPAHKLHRTAPHRG